MTKPPHGFSVRAGITGNLDVNVLLSFAFGIVFLAVMLGFSVYFPNPSEFQIWVWVTCLALSAAGVGAVLPGLLEVKYKSIIRATGAIGLFIIVYMFQPTLARNVPTYPEPTQDPIPVAMSFLTLLDQGKVVDAYNAMDTNAQAKVIDLSTFQSIYQNYRAPIGAAESRLLVGSDTILNPPGYPPGRYRSLGYKSKFGGQCRAEQIVLRAGQDLNWHVWTYTIAPATIPC